MQKSTFYPKITFYLFCIYNWKVDWMSSFSMSRSTHDYYRIFLITFTNTDVGMHMKKHNSTTARWCKFFLMCIFAQMMQNLYTILISFNLLPSDMAALYVNDILLWPTFQTTTLQCLKITQTVSCYLRSGSVTRFHFENWPKIREKCQNLEIQL